MTTVYPASIDAYVPKTDGVDYNLASHINDLQDSMVAVQNELGINPSGDSATVKELLESLQSNWISVGTTWTRTGNHTFSVPGNLTSLYVLGTKVRYKDGGSYEYGIVRSATYSAPNTTITLIANNDYAMAATTITDAALSYGSPSDFPTSFSYTPTYAGSTSGTPTVTTNTAKYVPLSSGAIALFLDVTITSIGTAVGSLKISYPWSGSVGSGSGRFTGVGSMLQIQTQIGYIVLFTYDNASVMSVGKGAVVGCVIDFVG